VVERVLDRVRCDMVTRSGPLEYPPFLCRPNMVPPSATFDKFEVAYGHPALLVRAPNTSSSRSPSVATSPWSTELEFEDVSKSDGDAGSGRRHRLPNPIRWPRLHRRVVDSLFVPRTRTPSCTF